MKDNAEQWVISQLTKYGASTPLMVKICKPIWVYGSVWSAIDSLIKKGIVKYEGDKIVLDNK